MERSAHLGGYKVDLPLGRYNRLLQVVGAIPSGELGPEALLEKARTIALRWLRDKKRIKLDEKVFSGEPWDFEAADSARALIIESSPDVWAFRFDDPDQSSASRVWRVEQVLAASVKSNQLLVGCALSAIASSNGDSVVTPSVPSFISQIASELGMSDRGYRLDGRAVSVDRDQEISNLLSLIENKSRGRAVVVLSTSEAGACFLDADRLARKIAGIAHVFLISNEASWEITRRYGREFAVFDDAVRVFRVNFDPDADSSFKHPLFLGRTWAGRNSEVESRIQQCAIGDTVAPNDGFEELPSFSVIRRAASESRLKLAASEVRVRGESEELARDRVNKELENLRADAQEWKELAIGEEHLRVIAERNRDEAISRNFAQQRRIAFLQERLAASDIDDTPAWPDSFEELSDWADKHISGRVVLTKKAIREARSSVLKNVRLAYQGLYHLATLYRDMRMSGGSNEEQVVIDAENALGLRRALTGRATVDRRYSDEYKLSYEGESFVLDQHLVGSDSRDLTLGLRIYFCWDPGRSLVIVGHLPTHLTNSLS